MKLVYNCPLHRPTRRVRACSLSMAHRFRCTPHTKAQQASTKALESVCSSCAAATRAGRQNILPFQPTCNGLMRDCVRTTLACVSIQYAQSTAYCLLRSTGDWNGRGVRLQAEATACNQCEPTPAAPPEERDGSACMVSDLLLPAAVNCRHGENNDARTKITQFDEQLAK